MKYSRIPLAAILIFAGTSIVTARQFMQYPPGYWPSYPIDCQPAPPPAGFTGCTVTATAHDLVISSIPTHERVFDYEGWVQFAQCHCALVPSGTVNCGQGEISVSKTLQTCVSHSGSVSIELKWALVQKLLDEFQLSLGYDFTVQACDSVTWTATDSVGKLQCFTRFARSFTTEDRYSLIEIAAETVRDYSCLDSQGNPVTVRTWCEPTTTTANVNKPGDRGFEASFPPVICGGPAPGNWHGKYDEPCCHPICNEVPPETAPCCGQVGSG
jgi:hypothetical protein